MQKMKDTFPYMPLMAFAMTGFICIMTETIPAGLLPEISKGMNISLASAGQWVTVYALGSLFAAIPLTIATRSWNRKYVLLMTVAGCFIFNTITALSSNVYLTLLARLGAGAAAGLAWSLLAGFSRRIVDPLHQGRAMAIAMAGTPLALSLGVPLGTWLGHYLGWRLTFGIMSVLSLLLMIWIRISVPDSAGQQKHQKIPFRKVLATPGVRPVLAVVLTWMLAHNILYTYIAPFSSLSGMGAHVDGILLIFGLSALAGLIFTGKIIDSHLRKMVLASLAIFSIVSLFLGLFSYTPAILIVGSAVWGVTFGGAATLLNTALADAAEYGADVAISMTVVSWNAAIALGGITGGIILQGPGVNGLPWVILILALVSFLIVKINSEYAFPHPIRDEAE
ncbi:MFS transporter [Klebsiella michiganensis]|uniref:MFS transporter n=3 Tax=Klebsiella michiganensis TaxID=1134687 RepID=UPI0021153670|nr:MFS transporter [Klebsiella michiganensis]